MEYVAIGLIGLLCGAASVYMIVEEKRKSLEQQRRKQDERASRIAEALREIGVHDQDLSNRESQLATSRSEFESKKISYTELQSENLILKRDIHNLHIHSKKIAMDVEAQADSHRAIDIKANDLGNWYLRDNVKWVGEKLNANNFSNSKQRLLSVIERCRGVGLDVSTQEESRMISSLREEYQRVVRAALEREEQARIKAQLRDEQLRQKEIDREIQQSERERQAVQAALDIALAAANNQHSEEVDRLKGQLAEAEAKSERAKSQAQLTRAGNVYVISNIGSFGEGVFKIGMTRRLEPLDRIHELGDASVPFPFDVHMMIASDDAPKLENALHRKLHKLRLNKLNTRKEFFKSDIASIYECVKSHHGEVTYVADSEALQYRQSLTMPDDDREYIESVHAEPESDEMLISNE